MIEEGCVEKIIFIMILHQGIAIIATSSVAIIPLPIEVIYRASVMIPLASD
jgi:hypothetical protein